MKKAVKKAPKKVVKKVIKKKAAPKAKVAVTEAKVITVVLDVKAQKALVKICKVLNLKKSQVVRKLIVDNA